MTPVGAIAIDDVAVIPAALVSKRDVKPSRCASIAAICESAGEHTKTVVTPETLLHRVQFRFLGEAAAAPIRAQATDFDEIARRLDRMDARSPHGPWTHAFLRAIEDAPQVPARMLAADLGWERLKFKAHVRRLKALGLTISHEVGYELSDLGRRYLASQ